jgi:ATP-binding cassette subfamily F protein uup
VTHDRYLLDRVSTEILALDGKGSAAMFAELAQWERAQEQAARGLAEQKPTVTRVAPPSTPAKIRLSWKEQRELEGMETAILDAERLVEQLQTKVSDPVVLADHVKSHAAFDELARAQQQVENLYARWAELEGKRA